MRILTCLAALVLASPSALAATYPFTLDDAISRFSVDFAKDCDFDAHEHWNAPEMRREKSFVSTVRVDEQEYQVFNIWCTQGAYNVSSVFYKANRFSGLRQVQFAEPVLDSKDRITGFTTTDMLVNADFSEENLELGFFAKGRGLGDCFTAGTYRFQEGGFVLKKYDVDSACDGRIRPKRIIDYK
jgi:hypothetical protein